MSVSRVLGYLKQADNDFNLINDGDKIAVGISGGKDSMILIYVLHLYKKFSKKDYTLVPIHVDEGFPDMDFSEIKAFLNSIGEDLFIEESNPNIYKVLKMHVKNDKLPCSICSKMKKAAINQAAIKYNCNKVAFAHHVDDAIETLFLNEIYGGRVATFTPSTTILFVLGSATRTFPFLPLSSPDITQTVSPFLIFIFTPPLKFLLASYSTSGANETIFI